MKVKIRYGTFETNSSSMHSIVVRKNKTGEYTDNEYIQNDRSMLRRRGILRLDYDDLEFGRYPFEILNTFTGKLRYAIASYAYDPDADDIVKKLEELAKEKIPSFKGFKFSKDDRYVEEDSDNNEEETYYYYGDVDHQSSGLLSSFLEKEGISIEEFLTNKKYEVFIDGDEYDDTATILKNEEYKDDVEKTYDGY